MTHLEKQSMMVMMQVLPSEKGRPVIKLKKMRDHKRRGTGKDLRGLAGGRQTFVKANVEV